MEGLFWSLVAHCSVLLMIFAMTECVKFVDKSVEKKRYKTAFLMLAVIGVLLEILHGLMNIVSKFW